MDCVLLYENLIVIRLKKILESRKLETFVIIEDLRCDLPEDIIKYTNLIINRKFILLLNATLS